MEAIFEVVGATDKASQDEYLTSISPYVPRQWREYQAAAPEPSYEPPLAQATYLLRYFPGYSLLLPKSLREVDYLPPNDDLTVSLFGCGPCSELWGLLTYLGASKRVQRLQVTLHDSSPNQWAFAREVVLKRLLPQMPNLPTLEYREVVTDFSNPEVVTGYVIPDLAKSDLVVFQNCLNEVPQESRANLQSNLTAILKGMRPNTHLVIIERDNYPWTATLMSALADLKLGSTLIDPSEPQRVNVRPLFVDFPSRLEEAGVIYLPRPPSDEGPGNESGRILSPSVSYRALIIRTSETFTPA